MQKSPFLTLVLLCWSALAAAAGKNTMMPDLQQVLGVAYDVPAELTNRAQPGSVLRWSAGRVGVFWSKCLVAAPEEITVTEVNMQSQLAGGVRMRFGGIGVDASAGSTLVLNFQSPYILTFDEGATTVITDDCRSALQAEARRGPIDDLVLVTEAMFAKVNGCKKVVLQGRAGIFGQGVRTETTTDCEIISDKPVAVGVRTVPASSLISQDTGPVAQVQLGGDSVDFGAVVAQARAEGGEVIVPTAGTAATVLGGGTGDLAAMAAQAKAQAEDRKRTEAALQEAEEKIAAQRARVAELARQEEARLARESARLQAVREAERTRQLAEEAALKRRMEAEHKRRIAAARETLLSEAESDMQPLAPLLRGPMTPATKRILQTYLSRYRSAKITVEGTTESVTIPGVSRIDRALSAETARDKAALATAQKQKLDDEKRALLARAAKDFASIAPLLEGEVLKEFRPMLELFVARYEGAKITVDDVEQTVVIPGVAKTQQALGGAPSDGTNSIGMKFVRIEAGSFTMGCTVEQGSDCFEYEKPAHKVTLTRSFYMQTTEVTQGQWRAVMGSNPSHFSSCGGDCPVEQVSWNDAVGFAQKLSAKEGLSGGSAYRLPTEAEWEYAARAGQGTKYAGSNSVDAVAWHYDNSGSKTHPVGQKSPNAWGLYDMSGNVCEWTSDWYGGYSEQYRTNPAGASSGSARVWRGGSWRYGSRIPRVAFRGRSAPDARHAEHGLRLLRTIP